MPTPATPVGRVIAVSAAQLIVLLQPQGEGKRAHAARNGRAGQGPDPRLDRLRHDQRAAGAAALASPRRTEDLKIIEIELIGESTYGTGGESDGFRRGVSIFPALEDEVYPRDAGGFGEGLCAAAGRRGPGRIDPPGCATFQHTSWSTICSASISASSAPPARANPARYATILRVGHRAEPARPCHAARPALRIRSRLPRRSDRAEPRRRAAPALLAVQFRGAGGDRAAPRTQRAEQRKILGEAVLAAKHRLFRQAGRRPPHAASTRRCPTACRT